MGVVEGDETARTATQRRIPSVSARLSHTPLHGEHAIGAVAAILVVIGGLHIATHEPGVHPSALLLDLFLYVVLPVAAMAGAVVLRRSPFTRDERWLAATLYFAGIIFLYLLVFWSVLPSLLAGESILANVDSFVLFGNLGGVLGLVAGFNRARAAQNDRLMGEVRTRRDQLAFINRLLRHNVLNSVQAIDGYAGLLAADLDGEQAAYVENIAASSGRITDLIGDVRTLITTLEGTVDPHPVDLTAMVREQAALVDARYDDATVALDCPERVTVVGNSVLAAVFQNLLDNAVGHNDTAEPSVAVTIERRAGVAVVRVADDGPGIPDRIVERYLAGETPAEGRGESLGLYLVAVLVEMFDGDVRVETNEPRGSVVEVTLPLARVADGGAGPESR